MSITANKGEWSEIYTLFKIFSDKKIPAADEKLNATNVVYEFLKIFREDEPTNPVIYDLSFPGVVKIFTQSGIYKEINISTFAAKIQLIFAKIMNEDKTFSIPIAEELMSKFLLTKVKANSNVKTDILAILKDHYIGETPKIGFSIKSKIGGLSTLLNASSGTNFEFSVSGLTHQDLNEVNSIDTKSKIKDRISEIICRGGNISFLRMSSEIFDTNLRTLDSNLPEILSYMLLEYYKGSANNFFDLTNLFVSHNPSKLKRVQIDFKIKTFLRAIALGMVPKKEWDTYLSVYGGYIIVKNNGDLVCYHLYNDDKFKDYLFSSVILDTPSSTRHNFGTLYFSEDNTQMFIKLNLQIRFIR